MVTLAHLTASGYIELAAAVAGRYCHETQTDLSRDSSPCYIRVSGDLLSKFYGKEKRGRALMPRVHFKFFREKLHVLDPSTIKAE